MDTTGTLYSGVPYGGIISSANVGANPIGVAVIPRLGLAVTANNGDSSASIVNISTPATPSTISFASAACTTSGGTTNSTNVCVGIAPTGVAIDQDRALAIVANTGGNSISTIDLTPLALTAPNTTCTALPCAPMQLVATSGPPTAIAVDPNRDEAVVTNIQNAGTTSIVGGLDVIDLTTVPPSKLSTTSINTLTANPTGIVYDPAVSPALFYVTSTQENAVYTFNPDSSATSQIRVGINPYSVAYNYQTGTILSVNSTSDTSSIIDAVSAASSVLSTRDTLGIGSQSQFSVAMDTFPNTVVLADQNNTRILMIPLP
jgi:DNA-binding beta-propeller fold protein YncE